MFYKSVIIEQMFEKNVKGDIMKKNKLVYLYTRINGVEKVKFKS